MLIDKNGKRGSLTNVKHFNILKYAPLIDWVQNTTGYKWVVIRGISKDTSVFPNYCVDERAFSLLGIARSSQFGSGAFFPISSSPVALWERSCIYRLEKMAGVQPPPLRSLDDFLLCSTRFATPDVRNLDRWNNRIINNLLYYQSNYFLCVLGFLLIVG